MKNYLVTGGLGFIGYHLVEHLLAKGHGVIIIDNCPKNRNRTQHTNIIIDDLNRSSELADIVPQIDGCFHLAAIANVKKTLTHWNETHQANAAATIRLFDTIGKIKPSVPIVYASSAAIYGDNSNTPLAENDAAKPLTPYAADKLSCELYARVANNLYQTPMIGLRFFNVYGPFQDPQSPYAGVISIFINKIKNKQPITVFGSGNQIRDFIYVSDIVNALYTSMKQCHQKTTTTGVFNVCTGKGVSINQLAQTLADLQQSSLTINYAPAWPGDITTSIGDPTLYNKTLKIKASIALIDGLDNMLQQDSQLPRKAAL